MPQPALKHPAQPLIENADGVHSFSPGLRVRELPRSNRIPNPAADSGECRLRGAQSSSAESSLLAPKPDPPGEAHEAGSNLSPTGVQPGSNLSPTPVKAQSRLVKASQAQSNTFEKRIFLFFMNPPISVHPCKSVVYVCSACISDNQRLNASFAFFAVQIRISNQNPTEIKPF